MAISRRSFLRATGAGAAATVAASCTGRATPPSSTPVPGPSGSSVSVPPSSRPPAVPPDWAALRAKLPGGLLLPGEPGYDLAHQGFNPLHDGNAPAAVALCTRPEDVQACVEVAYSSRIPIAGRSGGHSYVGYSTPSQGLVADLGGLSGVQVQPDGTAVIGAGTRLIDVYAGLAAGSCPTVGIAGLTLGGGIGVLTRKYGLTCDKLVSAQVVTADGTLRTASAQDETELFWALRGGGGGNFGIVTSFTFATEPAPDLAVFSLTFGKGTVPAVVGAWQEWAAGAPDELWSNCVVSGGSPATCRVGGCFVGPVSALNPMLDALVAKAGARPGARSVTGKGFLDAMRYFAGCSTRSVEQCRPRSAGGVLDRETFVASSRILAGPLADPAALADLMAGRAGMDLLLDSLGGAVSRVAPDATPFPHRSALASAQIYLGTTAAGQQAATQSVAEVRDGLAGLGAGGGYVNYIDAAMPDWATAYYGANAARLRAAAQKYDPDEVFAFAQSAHRS